VRGRIARQARVGPRQARLDVVCERPGGLAPVAIEIDRFGKVWSLQKLIAEADAGAVVLWVRWRGRTQVAIPAEIGLVDVSGARSRHAATPGWLNRSEVFRAASRSSSRGASRRTPRR